MPRSQIEAGEQGGGHAVEALSRRYHAVLLRYFARRGISHHDAQDLVQTVFTRLSKSDVLGEVESSDGYIFAIAANAVIDHARRRKVRVDGVAALQALDDPGQDFSPERVLEGRQELATIIAALNEMPERMRNILILARLENLTRTEIAQRLGISKSLVDQQIALATACLADRRSRMS